MEFIEVKMNLFLRVTWKKIETNWKIL